jgi:hypothetical protein
MGVSILINNGILLKKFAITIIWEVKTYVESCIWISSR